MQQTFVPALFEVAEANVPGRDLYGIGDGLPGFRTGLGWRGLGPGAGASKISCSGMPRRRTLNAKFGGFEAGVEVVLDKPAGGENSVAVGGGQGAPGEGLDGLGEDVGERALVFEQGDVDGALGACVDVALVGEAMVVAEDDPVAAGWPLRIG